MNTTGAAAAQGTVRARVDGLDWGALAAELNASGAAPIPQLLGSAEWAKLRGLYEQAPLFRSTIDLARYRFGSGQYRYFAYPLPELVGQLRQAFYPHLLALARDWAGKLKKPAPWPNTLGEWLQLCHQNGQCRPTPTLLRYRAGDWNALHQDLYGELVFPLQVVVGLDRPGTDHTGGEFLMVEQRARAQSRGYAATLPQGHGRVFTTRERPVLAARGWSSAPMRHGVSMVRSGTRHTLGLVFHDAT